MWHEIATFTAATGLSLGLVIGAVALFYFVATARPLAIAIIVAVVVTYAAFLYGEHDGRGTVTAQWNEANAKAAAAAKARDAAASKSISGKYDPVIAARDKQIADLSQQVKSYESMLLSAKGGGCPLGTPALRLRQLKARR